MALLLGVDTGGTCTDAAILDDAAPRDRAVLAKAKALTTHHDLSIGVARAVRAALSGEDGGGWDGGGDGGGGGGGAAPRNAATPGISPADIALVSLSTTLATNALVEGRGDPVGLILIGFGDAALSRAGLGAALGEDPAIRVAGGHAASGEAAAALDLDELDAEIAAAMQTAAAVGRPLSGFAVAGQFSVRNPAHELAARDLIRARAGLPVTCSHELSARVGGPRRALTTLLNARLIGVIDRLIGAVEDLLDHLGIAAPLMVVRGDGALAGAAFARARPIETILSGPAASLVGAGFLTGRADAVVADIGGTTTDIGVLRDGRPRLDADGARVGGHATMVEAVAMATHGLGGDSDARMIAEGLDATLTLGPGRALPLCLLARRHPALNVMLDAQLNAARPMDTDGRFLNAAGPAPAGLPPREAGIMARLADGPLALEALAGGRRDAGAAARLAARGLVRIAAFTPTDAAHVLGLQTGWDAGAARRGARLLARQRGGGGRAAAPDAETVSRRLLDLVARRSAEAVLETALAEDGFAPGLSRSPLAAAALARRDGLLRPRLDLTMPLVGLGASAGLHHRAAADLLGAEALIPDHADVANAVGAVAGSVRVTRRAVITQPSEGRYRVLIGGAPRDFADFDAARAATEAHLRETAAADAAKAGAASVRIRIACQIRRARVEGREMIVEAAVSAEAAGRPRLARPDRTADRRISGAE